MRGTRYTLVAGDYLLYEESKGRRVGFEPDGDSIGFRPRRPELLRGLGDPPRDAEVGPTGRVQVRLEGLDALELHYLGANHQKLPQCVRARDALLKLIGFRRVTYGAPAKGGVSMRVTSAEPHPLPGYILTRQVDPNGRPVAFVFSGEVPAGHRTRMVLSPKGAAVSINGKLLETGQAYPAYYESLPAPLRDALTVNVKAARAARAGVWAVDKTMSGVRVDGMERLARAAIWPKLYRRLAEYLLEDGKRVAAAEGMKGFMRWLGDRRHESRNDGVRVEAGRAEEWIRLGDLVVQRGTSLKMKVEPAEVIVVPR